MAARRRLINRVPGRVATILLGLAPFVLAFAVYLIASDLRLTANPNDKLLPSLASMGESLKRVALEPERRSGEIILWVDTAASLGRLGIGVSVSASVALLVGIGIGVIPVLRALGAPLAGALAMIPPMAVLPILFIAFGLGELSKVVLIVFGITPFMIRDLALRAGELPREQLVKAQTLGASTGQLILRVALPQLLPRLIDAVRLSLGAAWLFLIAAEAIAATEGLGYRIFLVRRYLAMDMIIPYVIWITLLAVMIDALLRGVSRWWFPWTRERGG